MGVDDSRKTPEDACTISSHREPICSGELITQHQLDCIIQEFGKFQPS